MPGLHAPTGLTVSAVALNGFVGQMDGYPEYDARANEVLTDAGKQLVAFARANCAVGTIEAFSGQALRNST
jgi:hypothetical protein